jgi:hypothetical protein
MGCNGSWEITDACALVNAAEETAATPIRIFPNPTAGPLTLTGFLTGPFTLTDALGRTVSAGVLNGGQLDLSALPAGVYELRLQVGDGWVGKRVVKG